MRLVVLFNPMALRSVNAWALLILVSCTLLLFPPVVAHADDAPAQGPVPKLPPFVRLEYLRGAVKSCPEQEVLEDSVISTARRDPFNTFAPALLRVTIARRGSLYEATIEVRDDAGGLIWKRPVDPLPTCHSLVHAIGFLIGDQLRDPPLPAPAPSPAPPPPPIPAARPAAAAATKAAPPPPRSERPQLDLGIASALAWRTTQPAFAFNLAADAGIRWRSFSAAVEVRFTPPQVADVDDTTRAWISVMQFSEGIVPCGHFRFFLYCGVGQVMESRGSGSPGLMPPSITVISVATGVRLGAQLPWKWWERDFALRLSADVLGTLHEPAFHVAGMGAPTWTAAGVTVAIGASFVTSLHLR